jgi:hypothetical protein
MERWKTRTRRWEFRAAQRRLERRQKASHTASTIRDEEARPLETGHQPKSENSNNNTEIAA